MLTPLKTAPFIVTSDDKTFPPEKRGEAIEHQFKLDLTGLVQCPEKRVNTIPFNSQNYTPRQVAEILVANADTFASALAKFKQVKNRYAKQTNSLARV